MKADKSFLTLVFLPLLVGFLLQPPPPPTPTPTSTPTLPLPTSTPVPTATPVVPTPTQTRTPTPAPSPQPGPTRPTQQPGGPTCLSSVEGLLLDAETGEPVPGVIVELRGEGWKTQTATGTDGVFRFYGLCYGEGELFVTGMTVVEGKTRLLFTGSNRVEVTLKAQPGEQRLPTPTPTPAPSHPGGGLPSTGWSLWLIPLGLLLAAAIFLTRELRRS